MSEKEEVMSTNSFSEDEQRMASEAYQAFSQGQYDSCIATLKKIQKNHPGDCKLMHNRAVAEFYKSGQSKTSDLKKNLAKVHKVTQQSHQEDEEVSEDTVSNEYSVLHFNQSILYYNLHQYNEALALLETLSTSDHAVEIFLLLAEIYLINYQPERAVKIISKLEEIFGKQSGTCTEGKEKGKQKSSGNVRSALPLLKTRCCLQMKSMKACKRELKTFTNLEPTSEVPASTINILSVFLKSYFEFQRGNYQKAYKLLGSSLPMSTLSISSFLNGECLMTMFYNNLGVIHFHLAKYNLGTFYLSKAAEENDKAMNMSTKKADGKHQQAGTGSTNKTLQTLNMNKKFELLYNMGIQLLFSGKPAAAFDCLISSVQVFYANPRLWLRLAECCIQANSLESGRDESASAENESSMFAPYGIVGAGVHQKLVVHPLNSQSSSTGSVVMPGTTLEFASVCLQNALSILVDAGVATPETKEKAKRGSKDDAGKKSLCSVPCFPAAPVSGQELTHLHASILTNSAFVALGLGNNLMAYEHARKLLKLPNLSGKHKYLGRMYSAEALVGLDRIADAIQQLSGDPVTDISVHAGEVGSNAGGSDENSAKTSSRPYSSRSTQICLRSVPYAQGCLLLNLSMAHSLRSEFEKAQKLLMQFSTLVPAQDVPRNAILLSVYINLHLNGGLPVALKVLQQNSLKPHIGPSGLPGFWDIMNGMKHVNSMAPSNQSTTPSTELSSNGSSISGASTGSRSKSSTPQPPYSGPPSGSVTPERMVRGTQQTVKSESTSKTKRGRR